MTASKRAEILKAVKDELERQGAAIFDEDEEGFFIDDYVNMNKLFDAIVTHAGCIHVDYCKGDCL